MISHISILTTAAFVVGGTLGGGLSVFVGSLVIFLILGDDKLNCRGCKMPAFIIKLLASEKVANFFVRVTREALNLSFCLGPVPIYTSCGASRYSVELLFKWATMFDVVIVDGCHRKRNEVLDNKLSDEVLDKKPLTINQRLIVMIIHACILIAK